MIKLSSFTGIVPKSDSTKLPDNAAKVAVNCDFTSGRIAGVQKMIDTGIAGGLGGFIYSVGDGTYKAYTLPYDADFVRSPVLQDSHKRFYWTGKNGSTKEFKFALLGENSGSTPSTSYNVGVSAFNVASVVANISVSKEGIDPPVSLSALSNLAAKVYLVKADGTVVKEVTSDIATGFTPVGTPVNGWAKSYSFTMGQQPDDYAKQISTATHKTVVVNATIPITTINNQQFKVFINTSTGEAEYAELLNGGVITRQGYSDGSWSDLAMPATFEFVLDDGQSYQVKLISGSNTQVVKSSIASPSFPASTSVEASSTVEPLQYRVDISFDYLGAKQTATVTKDSKGDTPLMIGSNLRLWLSSGTGNQFFINLEFGEDLPIESRAYIVTLVNDLGEESAPAGPFEIAINPGSEQVRFNILSSALTALLTDNAGRYALNGLRIYRSTGAAGSTGYNYVCTVHGSAVNLPGENYVSFTTTATHHTFVDNKSATALGEVCTTIDFIADVGELANLQGLTTLYNGILGAFKDNEVWFCEPYMPWAWKRTNVHTLPHRIVALLPQEQGVYILTEGFPYYASGASPEEMVPTKMTGQFPCVHKDAATVVNGQAVYISPDGPVFINGSEAKLDAMSFSREAWRKDYVAYVASGGAVKLSAYGHRLLAHFSPPLADIKAYVLDFETSALTTYNESTISVSVNVPPGAFGQWADNLAFWSGSGNWKLFAADQTGTLAWIYETKDFILPKPINLGAYQLFGSGSVVLSVYADNALIHTVTVTLSDTGTIGRLPSGFLAAKWSFRFDAPANTVLREALFGVSPWEFANA